MCDLITCLFLPLTQIVEALDYLHGQQVIHLDVKSSNVLVWHFPPPTTNRNQRLLLAGDVYVKLADYGISQLSTGSMIKVVNNPVGTPGYMAPEMFGGVREVSAEKVGVCWRLRKSMCPCYWGYCPCLVLNYCL